MFPQMFSTVLSRIRETVCAPRSWAKATEFANYSLGSHRLGSPPVDPLSRDREKTQIRGLREVPLQGVSAFGML